MHIIYKINSYSHITVPMYTIPIYSISIYTSIYLTIYLLTQNLYTQYAQYLFDTIPIQKS